LGGDFKRAIEAAGSADEFIGLGVVSVQAERRVVTRCIEDVEFEIGQEGANKLMGKEELKFVMADVDHVALEVTEVVALEATLAGREDAAAEFSDERLGPQAAT